MALSKDLSFKTVERLLSWERDERNAKDLNTLLYKWNILPDLTSKSFVSSKRIQGQDEQAVIKHMISKNHYVRSELGLPNDAQVNLKMRSLSCTVLSMSFFNKLVELGIIADMNSGYIRGCHEEELDGILIQDKLRRLCAKDNMGEHEMPKQYRDEFIFHLLKIVCIGGAKCQSEDKFKTLKEAVKVMYKDLIQVRKDAHGNIEICSTVYEIEIDEITSPVIFPFPNNSHNKFYVIISGGQLVTLLVKKYVPFW